MSCPRCAFEPVLATVDGPIQVKTSSLASFVADQVEGLTRREDPEVPMIVFQGEGMPPWQPSSYGGPRMCLVCGVLYCPVVS